MREKRVHRSSIVHVAPLESVVDDPFRATGPGVGHGQVKHRSNRVGDQHAERVAHDVVCIEVPASAHLAERVPMAAGVGHDQFGGAGSLMALEPVQGRGGAHGHCARVASLEGGEPGRDHRTFPRRRRAAQGIDAASQMDERTAMKASLDLTSGEAELKHLASADDTVLRDGDLDDGDFHYFMIA